MTKIPRSTDIFILSMTALSAILAILTAVALFHSCQ